MRAKNTIILYEIRNNRIPHRNTWGHFGKLSASTIRGNSLMWFVYMLLCNQKTFYIGISDDLKNRFFQHTSKLNISTKKFSDLELVYAEKYLNKFEAARRETQLKGWSHAKKQMLIDGRLGINSCTELANDLVKELEL